jgi:hypothetical protein
MGRPGLRLRSSGVPRYRGVMWAVVHQYLSELVNFLVGELKFRHVLDVPVVIDERPPPSGVALHFLAY